MLVNQGAPQVLEAVGQGLGRCVGAVISTGHAAAEPVAVTIDRERSAEVARAPK
jgi:hypothetical protein